MSLALGGAVASMLACAGGAQETTERRPIRILAAGDSITYGGGGHYFGYRKFLQDLCDAASMEVLVVGGEKENLGVGEGHEGHPGWLSADVLGVMPAWMERTRPDVVLLHIGTNDIYENRPVTETAANIEAIVETVGRFGPSAWCLVGTPGPFRSPKNAQAERLGQEIAALVGRRAATGQNVAVADIRAVLAGSGVGLPALLDDSAHPSDLGYYLMARTWFESLRKTR